MKRKIKKNKSEIALAIAEFEHAESVSEYLADAKDAYSPKTLKDYASAWRFFVDWCISNSYDSLPATAECLKDYISSLAERKLSCSTLNIAMASIRFHHQAANLPDNVNHPRVVLRKKGFARIIGRGTNQKLGLTYKRIEKINKQVDPQNLYDLMVQMVIAIGYYAKMRIDEILNIRLEHIELRDDGHAVIKIPKAKNDQERNGRLGYLSPMTVGYIAHWLNITGITEGLLVRSMYKSGNLAHQESGYVIRDMAPSQQSIAKNIKRLAKLAGLPFTKVSTHSMKIGMTQDEIAAGHGDAEIMISGDHTTPRMIHIYGAQLQVERGSTAKIAEKNEG